MCLPTKLRTCRSKSLTTLTYSESERTASTPLGSGRPRRGLRPLGEEALSVLPGPYLTSIHVMQVMPRLLAVIRFKATDVSSSEVGCAPHLKKNSCKNEEHCQGHGTRPAAAPPLGLSAVSHLCGGGKQSSVRSESEISRHRVFQGH